MTFGEIVILLGLVGLMFIIYDGINAIKDSKTN